MSKVKANKWQRKDWKRRVMVDRTAELRTRLLSVLDIYQSKSDLNEGLKEGIKESSQDSLKDNLQVGLNLNLNLNLKEDIHSGSGTDLAIGALLSRVVSLFPRDASAVRVKNRCIATGTASSVMRKFRMSRFRVREMALNGTRPGYRKGSW